MVSTRRKKLANLTYTEKEHLLEILSGATLKSKLYMSEIGSFFISLQNEYFGVSKKGITIFVPLFNFIHMWFRIVDIGNNKNKKKVYTA